MNKHSRFLSLALFLVVTSGCQAAGLTGLPTVFKNGNWTVLRGVDQMTDKVICTGIYKGDHNIQLGADSLYLRVDGGVRSVTLRFDDNPARPMRLPTELENRLAVVELKGDEFDALKSSKRLRVDALKEIRELFDLDLNLLGIREVLENIETGCPMTRKPKSK